MATSRTVLNGGTPIALGLVIAVAGAIVAVYSVLAQQDRDLSDRMSLSCERIAALEQAKVSRDQEMSRIFQQLSRIEEKIDELRKQ